MNPLPELFAAQAVLFDLGDTLLLYHTPNWQVQRQAGLARVHAKLAGRGYTLPPVESFQQRGQTAFQRETADHRVLPLRQRLAALLEPLGIPLDAALLADLHATFFADVTGRITPDPAARPLLAALRAAGIRTAIVSNCPWGSDGAFWRGEVARWGLDRATDTLVFCSDVAYRKPHPAPFQAALAALGAAPAQSIFVGDSEADIAGAQGVGMRAIWVDREAGPLPPGLRPDRTIRSLSELLPPNAA